MLVKQKLHELIAKEKASISPNPQRETLLKMAALHWMLWLQYRNSEFYIIAIDFINQIDGFAINP